MDKGLSFAKFFFKENFRFFFGVKSSKKKQRPLSAAFINSTLFNYFNAGQGLPAFDLTATVPNSPKVFTHSKVSTSGVALTTVIE